MLTAKESAGVAPEMNLRNLLHTGGEAQQARESTLALKPREEVTRSPKQGYQWPQKGLMYSCLYILINTYSSSFSNAFDIIFWTRRSASVMSAITSSLLVSITFSSIRCSSWATAFSLFLLSFNTFLKDTDAISLNHRLSQQ